MAPVVIRGRGVRPAEAGEGPELVSNGDFQTGDFTDWTEEAYPGTSWAVDTYDSSYVAHAILEGGGA